MPSGETRASDLGSIRHVRCPVYSLGGGRDTLDKLCTAKHEAVSAHNWQASHSMHWDTDREAEVSRRKSLAEFSYSSDHLYCYLHLANLLYTFLAQFLPVF